jgi:pseudaminic acid synthase
MKIGNKHIGDEYPTYIVAELSGNHCKNFDNAMEMIHKAKNAGADAVKIQTYRPDTITLNCDNEYFQIKSGTLWDGMTLYKLYEQSYTPWEWTPLLKNEANKLGLDFFSSPFDILAVDYLENIGVPAYKIASFEAVDHILLKKVAQTGKPVIISTGITDLSEITDAINVLRKNGTKDICVLKCTSTYPAPIEDANLRTIKDFKERFNVEAGLSDHTLGIEVPIASVCMGANLIEKHFTLSNSSGSADDKFSLEPDEFEQMVKSIRLIEKALGKVKYEKSDKNKNLIFTRSLFVSNNIKKGDIFTKDNIKSVRPGYGLHTKYYDKILGKKSITNISFGTPLAWNMVENNKILFLGDDNGIIAYLKSIGENVTITSNKITRNFVKEYDFVISYGYRHILEKDILDMLPDRIINLHISFLPWNRGADPNLWSFMDKTPKGVTIHYMDEGIDTGDIIVQKKVEFNYDSDTLASSYKKLKRSIEELFIKNWNTIKNITCDRKKQNIGDGSYHKTKDRLDLGTLVPNMWETKISMFNNLKSNQ